MNDVSYICHVHFLSMFLPKNNKKMEKGRVGKKSSEAAERKQRKQTENVQWRRERIWGRGNGVGVVVGWQVRVRGRVHACSQQKGVQAWCVCVQHGVVALGRGRVGSRWGGRQGVVAGKGWWGWGGVQVKKGVGSGRQGIHRRGGSKSCVCMGARAKVKAMPTTVGQTREACPARLLLHPVPLLSVRLPSLSKIPKPVRTDKTTSPETSSCPVNVMSVEAE